MIWANPYYDPVVIVNDTALLHLNYPLTFSSYIQPIAFPAANQNFSNLACIAAGWGKTSYSVKIHKIIWLFNECACNAEFTPNNKNKIQYNTFVPYCFFAV